jgi:hypothetical protein
MRLRTSRLRPLAGACAAALLLTACGSGGGNEGNDKPAAKDEPPSKADFTKAETALTELQADYQAVYDAGARVQKTSVAYFKSHPRATAADPTFRPLVEALDEAVDKRDEAAAKFAELDALEDSDVEQAYKTFATKAEKGDQFHDTLFAAFPLLEQTFAACGDVFTSTKVDASPSSPSDFGRTMLAQYRPAIADCLPVLEELSASENANLAAFASGFTDVVTRRRTLMTQLSTGGLGMRAFDTQYKKVAAQMTEVSKNIDFQKQLNTLSPVPEFLALKKVVSGKAA